MTHDRWSEVVREQIGLGRPLPLGGPEDGAWLAESAARNALGGAAGALPDVLLGSLRILPTASDAPSPHRTASVPPPPSALPYGPLRIEAEFAAPAGLPLPQVAADLRRTLWSAATTGLGLAVDEVDLRVTALLDAPPPRNAAAGRGARPGLRGSDGAASPHHDGGPDGAGGRRYTGEPGDRGDEERVAAAVRTVPGVTRLTGRLGGLGHPVHIEERPPAGAASGAALPARHVRVEIAIPHGLHPLEVAVAVRRVAADALADRPTVAVLVTDLD